MTAAMSGCNSGIFSAGRMLYTLGVNGQAPKFFTKISRNGVPLYGTIAVLIGLATRTENSAVAAGHCRRHDDEVNNAGCRRNSDFRKSGYKRTTDCIQLIPRIDCDFFFL